MVPCGTSVYSRRTSLRVSNVNVEAAWQNIVLRTFIGACPHPTHEESHSAHPPYQLETAPLFSSTPLIDSGAHHYTFDPLSVQGSTPEKSKQYEGMISYPRLTR